MPEGMESGRAPQLSPAASGGVILGKYHRGRLLGRGSFAKVYSGRSLCDKTAVAIKVIDKAKTDAAMEPRIIREVDAMRRLNNHPNILKIYEVMATKTKIYLVMELAEGGEVLARGGRLRESAARRYFSQVVSALVFCHQNGVTHRDIKPQNLLLDRAGNVKLSDFGLSALPEQLRDGMLHTSCGTPSFAAPEVFAQKGYDGAKADAWSCGVLLFTFLAGYRPFNDTNISDLYRKIRRREFEFPEWISKPSRYVINQLLDPNPDTRMSMDTLAHLSWFKRSSSATEPRQCNSLLNLDLNGDCKHTSTSGTTAFDIISMASGLDLSGLLEASPSRREKRFTAKASVEAMEERVTRVGAKLGYRVERRKGGMVGLVCKKSVLIAKIMEVQAKVLVVEVKAEVEELHWKELLVEIQELMTPDPCPSSGLISLKPVHVL